ncbi:hypothetical protein Clacol_008671 [Clathrus columnatus]|uniref:Uncharacterized protein n=1 Tax=Clathrus columnatus TaxID=1419009 RepID=A0AAV5AKX4_9AGAM|nr:hypothetical protein Clacol_008671 [Clathrus columnatus]
MSTYKALIKLDGSSAGAVYYSKFKVEVFVPDSETGVTMTYVYNINSDVSVSKFSSKGAPKERALDATVGARGLAGFDRFSGAIGDGRIYIRTDNGVIIKGPITGGPEEGQSFVGSAYPRVPAAGCKFEDHLPLIFRQEPNEVAIEYIGFTRLSICRKTEGKALLKSEQLRKRLKEQDKITITCMNTYRIN